MDNLQLLSKTRNEWMGIAIIMVLLYHLLCVAYPNFGRWLLFFSHWSIGVDFFIILSGFGLCYSYEKNFLSTFWLHRIRRVMPLYVLTILLSHCISDVDNSAKTIIGELTTLSIWGVGNGKGNWYVEAIMFFYLIFPILHKLISKFPLMTLIISNVLAVAIIHFCDLSWQQDCMVSRMPVFVFGIILGLLQMQRFKTQSIFIFYGALFICLLFWNLSIIYNISHSFLTGAISPIIILSFTGLLHMYSYHLGGVRFLGKYSYEIFIADGYTSTIMRYIFREYPQFDNTLLMILYWCVISILLGIVVILVSIFIQRCFVYTPR